MTMNDELNVLAAQALGQMRDLVTTVKAWQSLAKETGATTIYGMPSDTTEVVINNLAKKVVERGAGLTGNAQEDQQVMTAIRWPARQVAPKTQTPRGRR